MKVLRETLTVLPHSKLTWKFSGKWEHLLQRDKDNKIFLDYDAEWFVILIDYLREVYSSSSPDKPVRFPDVPEEHKEGFDALVELFGIEQDRITVKDIVVTPYKHSALYNHTEFDGFLKLFDDMMVEINRCDDEVRCEEKQWK